MAKRTLVSFDWAVKRLLRNKANFEILDGFFSELLMQDIRIDKILESEGNQQDEDDKFNRLDLLCQNESGELLIIEVQFYEESDYFQRCLYGTSKMITEYLAKGAPYSEVKKVYSVNILYFDLGQGKDYIYLGRTMFTGINQEDQLELSGSQKNKFGSKYPADLFPAYYLINVNNFDDVAKNTLDEWIYFLKHTELPERFKAKGLSAVEEQLKYDSMETADKQKYNQYLKEVRVSKDMLDTALERGLEQGLEQGLEKGKIEVVLKGHENGLEVLVLANITSLPEEEVIRILKEHGRLS